MIISVNSKIRCICSHRIGHFEFIGPWGEMFGYDKLNLAYSGRWVHCPAETLQLFLPKVTFPFFVPKKKPLIVILSPVEPLVGPTESISGAFAVKLFGRTMQRSL